MWEKFVHQLEAHPYLFGGVALGVVVLMFWGGGSSSSGTSSISAAESQAIAASAQANAQLQLSNDQVQMNAQNANAAVAINAANNAGKVQLAQAAASANSYNDDTAVKLAGIQSGAQGDLEQAILSSQKSAQDWITNLETNVKHYQLPNSISVSGLSAIFSPQSNPVTTPFHGLMISGATLDHSNSTSGAAGGSEGQAA